MADPTRPARFNAPAGVVCLLVCPDSAGMMCVGREVEDGRGTLLFAGQRPDGQWPTPTGWLPEFLAGGPGTAGVDDSGWRIAYEGVVPTARVGDIYGRGSPIGTWMGGHAELAVYWMEDVSPDRLVNMDPALFITGLRAAIAPVSTGPGVWRVPSVVTGSGNAEAQGSIHITSNRDGTQTGVVRSGRVVTFSAGQWQAAIGYGGTQ